MQTNKILITCLAIGVVSYAVVKLTPRDSSLSVRESDVGQNVIEQKSSAPADWDYPDGPDWSAMNEAPSKHSKMGYEDDWCLLGQLNTGGRAKYRMEIDRWRRQKGYFSENDELAYASYEDDALKLLGDQGDLLALDSLYERLYASRDTVSSANELLYSSIAFGSTKAAITLATIHRVKMRRNSDGEIEKEDLYRVMALYEIAAMGGDMMALRKGINFLKGMNIEVTVDERARISSLAAEILEDLRRDRDHLVQTDIQMERSKAEARYREYQNNRYFPDQDYDGWGSQHIERNGECANAYQSMNGIGPLKAKAN